MVSYTTSKVETSKWRPTLPAELLLSFCPFPAKQGRYQYYFEVLWYDGCLQGTISSNKVTFAVTFYCKLSTSILV